MTKGIALTITLLAALVIGLGSGIVWAGMNNPFSDAVDKGASAFVAAFGIGFAITNYVVPNPSHDPRPGPERVRGGELPSGRAGRDARGPGRRRRSTRIR
jgi:hypothetical protein